MHQPWQGSSRLTAPALQAWVTAVRMMEDQVGDVSVKTLSAVCQVLR